MSSNILNSYICHKLCCNYKDKVKLKLEKMKYKDCFKQRETKLLAVKLLYLLKKAVKTRRLDL